MSILSFILFNKYIKNCHCAIQTNFPVYKNLMVKKYYDLHYI